MKITLITVGKIKEKYLKDAIAEYSKRLSKYCKLTIVEVADEKTPDQASETVEEAIRTKEGERILKVIKDSEEQCLHRKNFLQRLKNSGYKGKAVLHL